MTMEELINRVRTAPGTNIYTKIQAVLDAVCEEPLQAVEILKVLGPWALLEYDRRTLKSSNLPERAIPGLPRSNPLDWHKSDIAKWRVWTGKATATFRTVNRTLDKIEAAYRNDKETYREVRNRLDQRTREQFEKWIRLRQLAA